MPMVDSRRDRPFPAAGGHPGAACLGSLVACVFLLLPGLANAADWLFYGGLGAGYAGLEVDQEPLEPVNFPGLSLSRDLEGSALTTQQFLGVRYGDHVALEASFFRYGTFKDETFLSTPDFPVSPPFPTATYATQLDGYGAWLVGFLAIDEQLEFFGKVGAIKWESDLTVTSSTLALAGDTDGTDLGFGMGLDFLTSGPFRARVEVQLLDIEVTNLNFNVTASAIYAFKLQR